MSARRVCSVFFFFNDTATTEIYTLSLHDALPICGVGRVDMVVRGGEIHDAVDHDRRGLHRLVHFGDRKSTRLNSSHGYISYAVFCLKKKKNIQVGHISHFGLLEMSRQQIRSSVLV